MKTANDKEYIEQNEQNEENKDSLASDIRSYIEARIQLLSLTIAEQISLVVAHSVQKLIGLILLGTALYFICFALGFYLGELLESYSLGFGIVALPFLIAGFIFIKQKSKRLTEMIQADLISKIIQEEDSSEVEEYEVDGEDATGSKN